MKPVGDISSVFPSLNGSKPTPLPPRFADIKQQIISGNEAALQASWDRLLVSIQERQAEVRQKGTAIIPTLDFTSLSTPTPGTLSQIHRTGAVIIRNVIPRSEAKELLSSTKNHISRNRPHVRAFPPHNPSVYELYWTPAQLKARSSPRFLAAQRFLQSIWHAAPDSHISTSHTLTYADRLRIRPPGDAQFSLGPHVDGGSVERWEDPGYRNVYKHIFSGNWEAHDPFDATPRLSANTDLYNSPGGCAMFRMFQGWLSLTDTGPGEGSLRLNPMLKETTAYMLLRPFFVDGGLENPVSSELQGAVPAASQELSGVHHPHLRLEETMVSVPRVEPGDFVAWHCDSVHAVDNVHHGKGDSAVLYIPATPLCSANVEYLKKQKGAASEWKVPPDFPGAGVVGEDGLKGLKPWAEVSAEGLQAMGMGKRGFDMAAGMSKGERKAVQEANTELFLSSS